MGLRERVYEALPKRLSDIAYKMGVDHCISRQNSFCM